MSARAAETMSDLRFEVTRVGCRSERFPTLDAAGAAIDRTGRAGFVYDLRTRDYMMRVGGRWIAKGDPVTRQQPLGPTRGAGQPRSLNAPAPPPRRFRADLDG